MRHEMTSPIATPSQRLRILAAATLVAVCLGLPPARADEDAGAPPEDAPETALPPSTLELPERPRYQPLIDLLGAWQSQGPSPTLNGQVEGIPGQPVIGAIHAVAAHPTNPDILFVGAVNGGVWRTTNATAANPNWEPLTDFQPSLSIGALEYDPLDASANTLLAGIGRTSSLGGQGGAILPGVLRTTDGGDTWTLLTHPLLVGQNIWSVAARGPTLLAASVVGGLFRSPDGGVTWTQVSGGVGTGLPAGPVADLVGDRGTLTRFYCARNGVGIFRSLDSGATWANLSSGSPALNAVMTGGGNNHTELAVFPNGRLYAMVMVNGVAGYIGFTDNPLAGAPTWTTMDLPGTREGGLVNVSGATNASPIVITTAANHGLSNADGAILAGVLGNTAANGTFRRVTVLNNTQFSIPGSTGNGAYAGGGTVQRVSNLQPREHPGGQGGIHASLAVDPNSPTTVYVGGDRQDSPFPNAIGADDFSGRLWRGDTTVAPTGAVPSPQWEHLTHDAGIVGIPGGGTPSGSAPHADSRDIVFDALGRMIQVDDGGVYRRDSPSDNTGDWVSLIGDLQCTEFHHLAYDSVADVCYGPTQDKGTTYQLTPGGATWSQVPTTIFNPPANNHYKGDGGLGAIDDLHFAPNSVRYVSFQNLGSLARQVWSPANTLVSETQPALVWTNPGLPPNDNTYQPDFYCAFETNALVAAAGGGRFILGGANGVFESTDNGATITRISTATIGDGAGIDPIAYGGRSGGVDNPDVLYFGAGTQVFVRTAPPPAPPLASASYPGGFVMDVAMDPEDWNVVFACDANQVFMSPDAGLTWNDVTGNLAAVGASDFWALAYVPDPVADGIVLGTGAGVFVARDNNWSNWVRLGAGLPNAVSRTLEYDAADDVLAVGTQSRGAWILPNVTAATDVVPPTVTCALTRRVFWPATRGLLDIGLSATATDNFDPPTALVRDVTVWSDEAAGLAPYAPDGSLTGGSLRLRAERLTSAGSNGRIYLVVNAAVDVSGNRGTRTCSVVAPLNLTVAHLTALLLEAATAEANTDAGGGVPPAAYANPILPTTVLP